MQTYQTKVKDLQLTKSQSAYDYLNAFGEQFGVFERKLFVLLYIHHDPPNKVKTSFTKQYGLTSRQYNALKFQLDGKVKSVIEVRNFQMDQLKGKIKEIELLIKRKEKQKETAFKKLQHISPSHDSFRGIVKKYRNMKFFLHQKKRKLRNVTQKLEKLLAYKKEKRIPICFGSKSMKAHYLGILRRGKQPKEGPFTSNRLEKLHQIRHCKLKDLFHKVSFSIMKHAQEENIDTIIIGKNNGWKQSSNIGKYNNQSFVSIPHSLLISMIQYKAKEQVIKVILAEESYTSKASFLDGDEIPTYGECESKKTFSGKRIKRGLYRSKSGFIINADVNGAANILKKTFLRLKEEAIFNKETITVWHPQSKIV